MSAALWAIAAALPLAAPPKLLINAQVDTRSGASGLESVFRPLIAAQTQAAWIGYSVPTPREYNLGCEYVSPGGRTAPGVIHLEPPDHAVVLFRVEAGAVSRIRVVSPDCEIDGGGAPLHWLDDVRPAESTALLESFAKAIPGTKRRDEHLRTSAIFALSVSQEAGALDYLISLARQDENAQIRRQCVSALARSRDPKAIAFFTDVLKH